MKKLSLLLLLSVITLSADSLTYRLDGSNIRSISDNNLNFSNRSDLLTGKDPLTLEELLEAEDFAPQDSHTLVSLTGTAGSEIYDPLLNLYEGTNSVNSDHFSELSGKILLPKYRMNIHGTYLYEDRYSQQFDRFQKRYIEHWGTALPMSSYGLAEDLLIKGSYKSDRSRALLNVLTYNHWGVLPGFDDQYSYRSGTKIRGGGDFTQEKFTLSALFGADNYRDQWGHQGDTLYKDLETSLGIACKLNEIARCKLNYHHSETLQSRDLIEILFMQNFDRLGWKLKTGVFTQYGYNLNVSLQYNILESLSFSADFHNGKSLGERKREWLSLDRPLLFSGDTISLLSGSAALNYSRQDIGTPFSIAAKSEVDRNPRYECIDTLADHYNVTVGSWGDRSVVSLGIMAKVSLEKELFGLTLDGKIKADLLDLPPLSSPGFYRLRFRGGRDEYRSFQVHATFEHRAPVTQTRFTGKNLMIQESSTEWNSGLTLNLTIPVVSPFLEERILPTIEMGAGPIRIGREQMMRELPGANPIGPEIYLKLVGDVILDR